MKNEIKIKKSGGEFDNSYHLSANLTSGQIIAIRNALEINITPVSYSKPEPGYACFDYFGA